MFGFDGTLYVGDLPVLAYARHCAEQLPAAQATALIDGIRFFLEGKSIGESSVDIASARNGYDAVEVLAATAGLADRQVHAAYRLARQDLAGSAFAVDPPDGLLPVLEDLVDVHVSVLAEADPTGLVEVLDATGLTPHVSEVILRSQPMADVIGDLLRRIDAAEPSRLLVVGDRWSGFLEEAAGAGAVTAMIDRFGSGDGRPLFRAADMAGLVAGIREWAAAHGAMRSEVRS